MKANGNICAVEQWIYMWTVRDDFFNANQANQNRFIKLSNKINVIPQGD